jgi:hypothetical protein
MTMLRRDFLRAISAFAAAASAGGTAAAGFTPPTRPAVWVPPAPAEPVISPAGIVNLTLVRGDGLLLYFDGFRHVLPQDIGWWIGGLRGTMHTAPDDSVRICLHATANQTALLRPGVVPWGIARLGRLPGGPAPQTYITGLATILPDDLWRAEEEVLKIIPQMHPLGIIKHRDRYEVMFRAPLRPGEESRYTHRVASLMDHCRPVGAKIINGGAGAQIDFAHKGLL